MIEIPVLSPGTVGEQIHYGDLVEVDVIEVSISIGEAV
jgi:hypothetical protein